jgi:hypothetical protein
MNITKYLYDLFNDIPIDVPITLIFNNPYEDIDGIVISKEKHSDYSYSLFLISLDKKEGGYYWIKPKHPDYFSKRIIGFKLINERNRI